jgi:uncharacterized membrane protein YtjA (UPF0391 family)
MVAGLYWKIRRAGYIFKGIEETTAFRYFARCKEIQAEANMLYWALVFLLIAVVAGVLGLTGVAILSAGIAKLLFFVFLVLFLITLVSHLGRRGTA